MIITNPIDIKKRITGFLIIIIIQVYFTAEKKCIAVGDDHTDVQKHNLLIFFSKCAYGWKKGESMTAKLAHTHTHTDKHTVTLVKFFCETLSLSFYFVLHFHETCTELSQRIGSYLFLPLLYFRESRSANKRATSAREL